VDSECARLIGGIGESVLCCCTTLYEYGGVLLTLYIRYGGVKVVQTAIQRAAGMFSDRGWLRRW
jgi:hypothetical protein